MSTIPAPDSPAPRASAADANAIAHAATTAPDAHGHNPDDYHWVPVLKKRRKDGWLPDKQRRFIEHLADHGSVKMAAQMVGMSEASAYALRRSPGAEGFDRAWTAATDAAAKHLLDEAFERALVGSDEPVFDRDGRRVGRRLRKHDKLLVFLLRAYMPERFRHAHRDVIAADEPRAPTPLPVAEALHLMLPEPPPDPAALLPEPDLSIAYEVADLCEGELPRWHRGDPPAPLEPHLDPELEALLESVKHHNAADYAGGDGDDDGYGYGYDYVDDDG